jgi:hypothetical protein
MGARMGERKMKARYSGPNRSGMCVCGCPWNKHHLGMVMNQEYFKATGEHYVPQECEAFGFNETGGRKYVDGEWVDHCHGYRDTLDRDSGKEAEDEH